MDELDDYDEPRPSGLIVWIVGSWFVVAVLVWLLIAL